MRDNLEQTVIDYEKALNASTKKTKPRDVILSDFSRGSARNELLYR